jgi:predicted nucleotidyltransferase
VEPQVEAQIQRVAGVVRDVLGPDVIGIYLYGSAMGGGLRPASDLDLLTVSDRPTTHEERARLIELLAPISNRERRPTNWRPVELTVVVASEIRPWRYPARVDFQYGEWRREDFARGDLEPEARSHSDLTVLLAMARESAAAVAGPPAAEIIDPIPGADLQRAMTDGVRDLLADLDDDTANVLLTLARIWSTLDTGHFLSKDGAADWAAQRMPEGDGAPLLKARDVYLGAAADEWSSADGAAGAAQLLVGAIEHASAAHG